MNRPAFAGLLIAVGMVLLLLAAPIAWRWGEVSVWVWFTGPVLIAFGALTAGELETP